MKSPKISVLVHNLSGNNVVRMYPIAKVLERFCEVEVVGFIGPGGVFPPYKDEFNYKTVPVARFPTVTARSIALRKLITGDAIYAFKPNILSLGVALLDRLYSHRIVAVDIEDYDPAFQYTRGFSAAAKNAFMLWDPSSLTYLWIGGALTHFAEKITVGSTFLQKKFGGVILPHGANTSVFDPSRFNKLETKQKWRLDGRFVIIFAGKVSEHKGVEALLEVVAAENAKDIIPKMSLLVIGGTEGDPNIVRLKSRGKDSFAHIQSQPHSMMPELLSLADLVVLPQKRSLYTDAQIPAKVYEALAMGCPVIASRVSDLPIILENCGLIVEPDNTNELREAILRIYRDHGYARTLGMEARKRAEEKYSWNAMEIILRDQFENSNELPAR